MVSTPGSEGPNEQLCSVPLSTSVGVFHDAWAAALTAAVRDAQTPAPADEVTLGDSLGEGPDEPDDEQPPAVTSAAKLKTETAVFT